jgi:hypothetical protein
VVRERLEVTAKVPTSGRRTVGKTPATGEVTFFNQLDREIVLPAGTRLLADTGARFVVQREVRIPPLTLSGVRVLVTAADPGTVGNVYAGGINRVEGQPMPGLVVRNEKETTGGTDEEVRAVSGDDVGRVREALQQQARARAEAALRAAGGGDRVVAPQTIQVQLDEVTLSKQVNEQADEVEGRAIVLASGTAFSEAQYKDLVQQLWVNGLPSDTAPGGEVLQSTTPVVAEVRGAQVKLEAKVSGAVVRRIDRDRLVAALRGKPEAEAWSIVRTLDGVSGVPKLQVWPSWVDRAYRVDVRLISPE